MLAMSMQHATVGMVVMAAGIMAAMSTMRAKATSGITAGRVLPVGLLGFSGTGTVTGTRVVAATSITIRRALAVTSGTETADVTACWTMMTTSNTRRQIFKPTPAHSNRGGAVSNPFSALLTKISKCLHSDKFRTNLVVESRGWLGARKSNVSLAQRHNDGRRDEWATCCPTAARRAR